MQDSIIILYIIIPWLIYFIPRSLYLLIPFAYFANLPPLASGSHQPVLCIYELAYLFIY